MVDYTVAGTTRLHLKQSMIWYGLVGFWIKGSSTPLIVYVKDYFSNYTFYFTNYTFFIIFQIKLSPCTAPRTRVNIKIELINIHPRGYTPELAASENHSHTH